MSHLADSDGTDPETVKKAVELFDECVEAMLATGAHPKWFHVAQSAGSLKAHSRHANAIRLGIGLYGLNPFPAEHPLHDELTELQPALQLFSTITKVTELKKGDKVSYNYTFTAPKAMRIGVLPSVTMKAHGRSPGVPASRSATSKSENSSPLLSAGYA